MKSEIQSYDVVIVGGGAAGLMCAIEGGKRGRKILVLEHSDSVGSKILISGGGRCNFTNLNAAPPRYQSKNPHFCKSALARYTQHDFIALVEKYKIQYYEKKLGQLFCTESAREIVKLLLEEARQAHVDIICNATVKAVEKSERFLVSTTKGEFSSDSFVVASGGISIPKMGATDFGYRIAQQFGLKLTERFAGLVPFMFDPDTLKRFEGLSGISFDAEVSCNGVSFRENILITHRGVSGPAILQISSFWRAGDTVEINLLPNFDLSNAIADLRRSNGKVDLKSIVSDLLPKRFVQRIFEVWLTNKPVAELNNQEIAAAIEFFHAWKIKPVSTEGYRTAEVTVGGVDSDEISSKTFESKKVAGLYFIGEVLDVTGWLGGYNFQWAWSSGWCAGQYV